MWNKFRSDPDHLVFFVCMLGWFALAIVHVIQGLG
jgi:hypothetical protein